MVICLERGADLDNMAQLMPLPLTVSCFSKIQIGFTFLVPAHPGSPAGQRAVKLLCVCVCVCVSIVKIEYSRQPMNVVAAAAAAGVVGSCRCARCGRVLDGASVACHSR